MTAFNPGTAGTLTSTYLAAAFVEAARGLNAQELAKNAATPGVPAENRITMSAEFDGKVMAITGTLPITVVLAATGVPEVLADNYLGAAYGTFNPSDGELESTQWARAFLEVAHKLSKAEEAVSLASRPNNIQIQYDAENAIATVTANIPFTDSLNADGSVKLVAVDYV